MLTFAAMNFYFRIFLVPVLGLLLLSCKKDPRMLDASAQPEDDLLTAQFNESAVLYGYAENAVPVPTLNDRYKFIGSHNDPVFGRVDAGLYLNINTTLSNINFSATPVLDSAEFVFLVDLERFEGDFQSTLTFSVFTLDSTLSNNRNYTTDNFKLHNPVPLPTTSTVKVSGGTIRIKLDKAYAEEFIKHPEYLTSNEVLQQQYKGFFLSSSPTATNEGIIARCDLEDGLSGLFFYLRASDTSTVQKQEKFNFSGSSAVRFNAVKQDLSTAHPALKAQTSADSVTSPNFFVKGLGVTNTRIFIPKLTSYADSADFAVNRAEITFKIDNSVKPGGFSNSPPALCLLPLTPAGRDTFAVDQMTTLDNARYGGSWSQDQYTFNITRHVQAIVDGKIKNHGFVLVVANPERLDLLNTNGIVTRIIRRDIYAQGAVLFGPAAGENAPRLQLSFIRLNK
jgi:hypothetical protein